jgi:cation transport ATPase
MEKQEENLQERVSHRTSNVFSLAVAVGLITFFITSEWAGGLSGTQGFFVGLSAIVVLFVISELFSRYRGRLSKRSISPQYTTEGLSVSHVESEGRVIINIYVNKKPVLSQEVDNVR